MRLGARDCILRPVARTSNLNERIRRELSATADRSSADITSEDVEEVGEEGSFVGASPIMRRLRAQAEFLAETDAPVLIIGESGSGKETIARLIHHLSVRSGSKFAKVNCSALPSDLLEAELFGYERDMEPVFRSRNRETGALRQGHHPSRPDYRDADGPAGQVATSVANQAILPNQGVGR